MGCTLCECLHAGLFVPHRALVLMLSILVFLVRKFSPLVQRLIAMLQHRFSYLL
jgi:hypothetical protein